GLDAGDGRALLADRDVDAAQLLLRVAGLPVGALVVDRVDADLGLAGLAVADDQLALAAADRGHRVDGLDAGLDRLADRLAAHDVGGLELELAVALGLDVAQVVDGVAQGVDDAAQELVAHRDGEDLAGALDGLALGDLDRVAQQDGADLADVEVQGQAHHAALEFEQLVGHRRGQALDDRDAVACAGDGTDLFARDLRPVGRDVVVERTTNLVGGDGQFSHRCVSLLFSPAGSQRPAKAWMDLSRRLETEPSHRSEPTCTRMPPTIAGSTVILTPTGRP